MVTVAKELPLWPTVDVGFSVIEVGGGCGVTVICACVVVPFQLAVTLAAVLAATLLVCSGNESDQAPAGRNTDVGGLTAGESLASATIAPAGGGRPVCPKVASLLAPPLVEHCEIYHEIRQ